MTDAERREIAGDVARWRTRATACTCVDGTCAPCQEWTTHYDAALAQFSAVRDATLEAVRERVEAEEELDGPMTDAVWDRMRDSRQAAAEMLRAAVSATKRNILAALDGMGATDAK
jgi:primosomal protein N'